MDPDKEFPPPPPSQADPKLIGYIEQAEGKKQRRALFPWFFLGVNVVMLIWLISGIVAASHTSCQPDLTAHACTTAREVGGSAGAIVIGVVWVIVDIILGGLYVAVRALRKDR